MSVGAVLGKVTASGKHKVLASTAPRPAAGILYDAVDASGDGRPRPADPSIADAIAPAPGPTGACATS